MAKANKEQVAAVVADANAKAEKAKTDRTARKQGQAKLEKALDAQTNTGNQQKSLAQTVAEADVMPRATDKQVRDAKKKAEAATRVSAMVDEQVAAQKTANKRAGRRGTDPVVPVVSVEAGTLPAGVVDAKPESDEVLTGDGAERDEVRPGIVKGKVAPEIPSDGKYHGPMLALRERLKRGIYQKAENGQPSCGDDLAVLLGKLAPPEVIRACLIALDLPNNPYLHLNIGQQSMNLRNKLRGALKKGLFGMGVVTEAIEEVVSERPAPETDAEKGEKE